LCNQLIDGTYNNFPQSTCIHNTFYESPMLCKTQQYCKSPDDITKE
jgi:hypothetical protein